ncbi:MAG: hypothetical protein J7527_12595, partial [Chitinophagaceae bacterium]|nr:hypothetical protein [Chitinophagaceae bacterium]
MLRKLSVSLVACHCFVLTFAQPASKQVTVTATLKNGDSTSPRAMVFNFLNPFIRERKSTAFNEKNQLSASEEMLFNQNMTVQYNG